MDQLDFQCAASLSTKPCNAFTFEGEKFVNNAMLERNLFIHRCAANIARRNVPEGTQVVPALLFDDSIGGSGSNDWDQNAMKEWVTSRCQASVAS